MTSNTSKTDMNSEFTLDHVGISVSNLNRSIDFYGKIFGFTCERVAEMMNTNRGK